MTPKERVELKRKIRLGEKVSPREVLELVEDNEKQSQRVRYAYTVLSEIHGQLSGPAHGKVTVAMEELAKL